MPLPRSAHARSPQARLPRCAHSNHHPHSCTAICTCAYHCASHWHNDQARAACVRLCVVHALQAPSPLSASSSLAPVPAAIEPPPEEAAGAAVPPGQGLLQEPAMLEDLLLGWVTPSSSSGQVRCPWRGCSRAPAAPGASVRAPCLPCTSFVSSTVYSRCSMGHES